MTIEFVDTYSVDIQDNTKGRTVLKPRLSLKGMGTDSAWSLKGRPLVTGYSAAKKIIIASDDVEDDVKQGVAVVQKPEAKTERIKLRKLTYR